MYKDPKGIHVLSIDTIQTCNLYDPL